VGLSGQDLICYEKSPSRNERGFVCLFAFWFLPDHTNDALIFQITLTELAPWRLRRVAEVSLGRSLHLSG